MKAIITLTGRNDVSLKAITTADLAELAKQANDPAIAANLRDIFPSPYTLKDAEDFLSMVQQGKLGLVWGIFYNDHIAGVINIRPGEDIYRHSGEIGCWLGTEYQNRGIASEAITLITTYAFKELNLYRLFSRAFEHNQASHHLMINNGYHLEAVHKKSLIKNGNLYDECLFVKLNDGG